MELSNYFNEMKKYSESQISTGFDGYDPRGTILNLCRNKYLGTAVMRPLTDSNDIPMRPVHGLWEIYESFPVLGDDGKQVYNDDGSIKTRFSSTLVGAPELYIKGISPENASLLNEIRSKLEEYNGYLNNGIIEQESTSTNMGVKYRQEITYFWAKVFSVNTADGKSSETEGYVRLIRHNSSRFFKVVTDYINDTTNIKHDGGKWLESYFNRKVGTDNHIMSVNTKLETGYTTIVSFTDGANYEVTNDDVKYAVDLNSVGYDITNFDKNTFTMLLDRINKNIELAKSKMMSANNVAPASNPLAQYQQVMPQNLSAANVQPQQSNVSYVPNAQIQPNQQVPPNVQQVINPMMPPTNL